ncbi:MAG: hypothetical protein ACYC2H_13120 [Thermoplasmatota archaeon]
MKPTALPAIALLVLLAPLAGAADAQEDAAWRLEPRILDVKATEDGFTFTSARDTPTEADRFTGSFDAGTGRLALDLQADRPEPQSIGMDLAWTRLVEYRDADGDGRYGLADETLQAIPVPGLPAQTVVTPLLGGGNAAAVAYTLPENASSPDPVLGGDLPGTRGTLRLTFSLVPTTRVVGGSAIEPTEVRITTEVRDFPFQAGDSRLALVADASTDAARLDAGDSSLQAAGDRYSWLASWQSDALVDGAALDAAWSSLANDAARATAVLSLPRGDAVSHDGSMSAHRSIAEVVEAIRDLPPGDWRFYAMGLGGVALALGFPSLRRLREP